MARLTHPRVERPVCAQAQITLPSPALPLARQEIPFRRLQPRIALRDLCYEPALRILFRLLEERHVAIERVRKVDRRDDAGLRVGQVDVEAAEVLPAVQISGLCVGSG